VPQRKLPRGRTSLRSCQFYEKIIVKNTYSNLAFGLSTRI
jgi:hypothetical protein